MLDLVSRGMSIIMISSELPEVLGMSDRIYVMSEWRIAGELSREEATEERVKGIPWSAVIVTFVLLVYNLSFVMTIRCKKETFVQYSY